MSMYRRFPSEGLPSFVTTNTLTCQPIFRSRDTCELFLRILYEVRVETGFQLLAFSIMPDHVHLVLVPGEQNLGRILQLIKGRFSRAYNQTRRQSGSLWQSQYHERTLRSETALFRAIEYVHGNPVAAQLAREPYLYRWSTGSAAYPTDSQAYLGQAEG